MPTPNLNIAAAVLLAGIVGCSSTNSKNTPTPNPIAQLKCDQKGLENTLEAALSVSPEHLEKIVRQGLAESCPNDLAAISPKRGVLTPQTVHHANQLFCPNFKQILAEARSKPSTHAGRIHLFTQCKLERFNLVDANTYAWAQGSSPQWPLFLLASALDIEKNHDGKTAKSIRTLIGLKQAPAPSDVPILDQLPRIESAPALHAFQNGATIAIAKQTIYLEGQPLDSSTLVERLRKRPPPSKDTIPDRFSALSNTPIAIVFADANAPSSMLHDVARSATKAGFGGLKLVVHLTQPQENKPLIGSALGFLRVALLTPSKPTNAPDEDPLLDLTIHIRPNGFALSTIDGKVGPTEGCPADGPTICKTSDDRYDWKGLRVALLDLKKYWPDDDTFRLRADPTLPCALTWSTVHHATSQDLFTIATLLLE